MTTFYLYGDHMPAFDRLLADRSLPQLVAPLLATAGGGHAATAGGGHAATAGGGHAATAGGGHAATAGGGHAATAATASGPPPLGARFERARAAGLLTGDARAYGAGRRLVPVPVEATDGLRRLWHEPLDAYAAVAVAAARRLEGAVATLPVGRTHGWPRVCHLLVAGCLLDLAVGALLAGRGTVRSEPAGDTVVWAIARPGAANAFGIRQWRGRRSRAMLAQLWHHALPARTTRLADSMVDRLVDIARGGAGVDPRHDLYLRHQALLRRGAAGPELRLPDFGPDAVARLTPILFAAAEEMVERGVDPALERLRGHRWWSGRVAGCNSACASPCP